MKRILTLLSVFLLLVPALTAATISRPVATVYLTKNEAITQSQLDAEVERYKAAGMNDVSQEEVLEAMINERIFLQGATRDGFSMDDRTLNSLFNQQRTALEQSIGQKLTDEEFEEFLTAQYGSVDAYKDGLRNQAIMQNYVSFMKADEVADVKAPTDAEIRNWYRQNQTTLFAQGELQRVSVISINKTGDEKKDAANKAKLEQVAKDLDSGKITFEKAVQQYSDDTETKNKGGDAGWLVDNAQNRMSVGDDFVSQVMELDVGERTGVIETPNDYAIAKVTAYMPAKILTLDDPITPDEATTVREYIRAGLTYQNSQLAFMNAYASLMEDLKKEARVTNLLKK